MKFIFSKDMHKLPSLPLPQRAMMIGKASKGLASDYARPVIITFILSIILVEFLCSFRGREYDAPLYITVVAAAVFFLMLPLHEFLHIVPLPKTVRKNITIVLAGCLMGVYYPNPITKSRYIFISALPNIILVAVPLVTWLLYPEDDIFSQALIHYLFFSIVGGAGDYWNILMVLKHVPKGAMVQNVLEDGYWFMESETTNEE